MSTSQMQLFDRTAPAAGSRQRRNLVIEAGAGTGKTTAIAAEVLRLLAAREDLSPERIVLMTFTDKAAGEIAERIRTALEEIVASDAAPLVWPIDSPKPLVVLPDAEHARRTLEHHLSRIDSLRSQTIHSFCQSLLRSFPLEAGLDPQFKIIEGFERSLLYDQIYDAWIDEETRLNPVPEVVREWELLFEHAGYLFRVREMVMALLERRDLLDEPSSGFGDISDAAEQLLEAIHLIRQVDDETGDQHARRVVACIRETEPPDHTATLEQWLAYLQPIAPSIREASLPRKGSSKEALSEALKILRCGDKGSSVYDALLSHRAGMTLVALSRRFAARLEAEKRKLGIVDFDDLLLRTLTLLDDPDVLSRARKQFDYIFVDEFQDTDRTQARIIDRLARDDSGAYVPGRTVVVGDPKQSIYGFRRADPETYYQMTERLVGGGAERRVIRDQYRSDPPLLAAINEIFTRLLPAQTEHDPNVFTPTYHTLIAARTSARRELDARITLLRTEHDDQSDRFVAEGEAIAEWIRRNRDGSEKDLQRFAILFRRLTKLDDYLDVLDRAGIEYVLPPTRLFLDRRAPVDLLAVLRAIAWSFDLGAQISAARTPYFALTDVEITQGVIANQPTDAASAISVGDDHAWNAFTTSMRRFRDAARHLTVSQLIDLVIETTGIEQVYGAAADGNRSLRHLEHLRTLAFDYDLRSGGSVRQFVDEIASRREEPEEVEPVLTDEMKNAVRIMTVHAAKGLEFDTVILPDLSFPVGGNELKLFTVEEPAGLVLAPNPGSISGTFRYAAGEKLKEIASRRDKAEMRRLFYVAATRARTDLVFVCNTHEKTQNKGFITCLTDAIGIDLKSLKDVWPDRGREIRSTAIGPVAFERLELHEADERNRERLRSNHRDLEAALRAGEIVPHQVRSPQAETPRLTPREVAARRAGARSRSAGVLLHRLLELWNGRDDFEPLLRGLGVEAAADAETIARVRKRLKTVIGSPMLARVTSAEILGREVPIQFVEDGIVAERRIDLLLRESAAEVVVDYKSGVPEAERVEKDRLQVRRYCQAISEMTGRNCEGVLWYIDLERDEVVNVP